MNDAIKIVYNQRLDFWSNELFILYKYYIFACHSERNCKKKTHLQTRKQKTKWIKEFGTALTVQSKWVRKKNNESVVINPFLVITNDRYLYIHAVRQYTCHSYFLSFQVKFRSTPMTSSEQTSNVCAVHMVDLRNSFQYGTRIRRSMPIALVCTRGAYTIYIYIHMIDGYARGTRKHKAVPAALVTELTYSHLSLCSVEVTSLCFFFIIDSRVVLNNAHTRGRTNSNIMRNSIIPAKSTIQVNPSNRKLCRNFVQNPQSH